MLSENSVKKIYEKALERASGYCRSGGELYETHIYYACELGKIIDIDSKETLRNIKGLIK